MESENILAQSDELLAISSIYDEREFISNQSGGNFFCFIELEEPIKIVLQAKDTVADCFQQSHLVTHLSPITLRFVYPADYPSVAPPHYSLSAEWLSYDQILRLKRKLHEIWLENLNFVVLFLWIDFLKKESVNFLGISSIIELQSISKSVCPVSPTSSMCESPSSENYPRRYGPTKLTRRLSPELITENKVYQLSFDDHLLLFSRIIEHNRLELVSKFNQNVHYCQICLSEKSGNLCIQLEGCLHVFCHSCMEAYFRTQIVDGSVNSIVCPFEQCEQQIEPFQVKSLISSELYERYDRLLLQNSLDSMSDVTYCPLTAVCGRPIVIDPNSNMGSCPFCQHNFCLFCKKTYHGVSPCKIQSDQILKIREEYLKANEEERKKFDLRYGRHAIKRLIEESYSEEYLTENAKKCPSCNSHIEKTEGCNKMQCSKCRGMFCWICLAQLSRTDPYAHFRYSGSSCFNLLFQGEDVEEYYEDEEFIE